MPNKEIIELIDKTAAEFIIKHRDPAKIYTGHDEPHLRRVARLTALAGLAADYPARDIELSRIAGWFHDFERSMNETNAESDETLSAQAATKFLEEMHSNRLYCTTSDEREAIKHAILKNGRPPEFFGDRPAPKEWAPAEKILATLFVADKMEQNGVWVIARRSQFVAGARLRAEDADLPDYGLQPNKDENKAVLLESAVRITFINPEDIYPPTFKPLTARMYGPQRDFIHGLLAAERMNLQGYAELILKTNYLETRKLKILSETDLAQKLRLTGGLSDDGIKNAHGDLADSAVEAVTYFSSNYEQPLEELVQTWRPQNNTAKQWQTDMMEYISGEWFDKITTELT